jgi:hypothetical protein
MALEQTPSLTVETRRKECKRKHKKYLGTKKFFHLLTHFRLATISHISPFLRPVTADRI